MEDDDIQVIDQEVGLVGEVEADEIDANNAAIKDLIKSIEDKNFTQAEYQFNDMVGDRLGDVLDQAKVKLAGEVFNDEEPESDEEELELEAELDDELEDEEVDDEEEAAES